MSENLNFKNACCRPLPRFMPANVTDGSWHMVTLTTRPDATRGIQLYVDAQLAAEIPSQGACVRACMSEEGGSKRVLRRRVSI